MAGLSDLPMDLFHVIVLFLVNSSDGADFARAMSVCRMFRNIAEDKRVLEALSFENVSIAKRCRTFLQSSNLLFKCAGAGNLSAQHLLSKVLLMSCSLLHRSATLQPSNILLSPDPLQTDNDEDDDGLMAASFVYRVRHNEAGRRHSQLVLNFLRRCTPSEIVELGEHLSCYIRYFTNHETVHHARFYRRIEGMVMYGRDVVAGAKVNLLGIRRTIYEKHGALVGMQESRKRTRGASSSYSIADVLLEEIDFLQTKMETMYELGLICRGCGYYEKNPSIYFEGCRVEAMESFDSIMLNFDE